MILISRRNSNSELDQFQYTPVESHKTQYNTSLGQFEKVLAGFQELDSISDSLCFAFEFEQKQKASGLRLTTFRAMYQVWTSQQGGQG